jgi:hypothetical protein
MLHVTRWTSQKVKGHLCYRSAEPLASRLEESICRASCHALCHTRTPLRVCMLAPCCDLLGALCLQSNTEYSLYCVCPYATQDMVNNIAGMMLAHCCVIYQNLCSGPPTPLCVYACRTGHSGHLHWHDAVTMLFHTSYPVLTTRSPACVPMPHRTWWTTLLA